jgi:hypothetical protein
MFGVDRTVIGSERWRWHPFNPFQVKRHGDNPIPFARGSGIDASTSQS